jgi:serine/threonine protein kinase
MSKLLKRCSGKFSLKTSLLLGIEIISILQYFHFKNFIHCGIRPEHLMIGSGNKFINIFIVDYATSIKYRDNQTLEHINEEDKRSNERYFNMEFSSVAFQKGDTPSRKDDVISFLYMIAYFQKGELPWSKLMK